MKKIISILLVCLAFTTITYAQTTLETSRKVDTLSLADRIAIRSNAVDWFLLVPNIGVEFDLGDKNHSRWTLGLNLRYNWQEKNDFKPGVVWNVMGARLEVRNYWRMHLTDQADGAYWAPHTKKLDRFFSRRTDNPKHPLTTYYMGGFLSYDKVSVLISKTGRQGSVISGGVTMGMIKPMYVFKNGNSLDLDLGLCAGISMFNYDSYTYDRESNCYPLADKGVKKILPFVPDVSVALVYRFGKKPITAKYRWRYDCDMAYMERVDSISRERYNVMQNELNLQKTLDNFQNEFDSLYIKAAVRQDSINRANEAAIARVADAERAAIEEANADTTRTDTATVSPAAAPTDTTSVSPTTPADTTSVSPAASSEESSAEAPTSSTAPTSPTESGEPAGSPEPSTNTEATNEEE